MTYETVLALKNSGFPQNPDNELLHPPFCTGWEPGNKCTEEDQCRVPTLSELIEACKAEIHLHVAVGGASKAIHYLDDGEKIDCMGSTPEESVARLWLALNENKND